MKTIVGQTERPKNPKEEVPTATLTEREKTTEALLLKREENRELRSMIADVRSQFIKWNSHHWGQ